MSVSRKEGDSEQAFLQWEQGERRRGARALGRLLFFGLLLLAALWIGRLVWDVAAEAPSMDIIQAPYAALSSRVYSGDGSLLARLHQGENREVVSMDAVSPNVLNALLATEDKRFYHHAGIDGLALPAIVGRLFRQDRMSGASTITMQLARNLYSEVGKGRTIRRKIREMVTAVRIERYFTKEQILAAYLNTVNIYSNCYGIETAAYRLFGKSALDLNETEAALIVGLLKGQGQYNPRTRPGMAVERRNTVLALMAQQGFLPKPSADSLMKLPLGLAAERPDIPQRQQLAPYFVERVRIWVEKWAAENGYDPYRDGLQIYTSLDPIVQQHAETAMRAHMEKLQKVFDAHIAGREAWRKDPEILYRLARKSDRYYWLRKAGHKEPELWKHFEKPRSMQVFAWSGVKDTVLSPMDSVRYYSRMLETGMAALDPRTGQVKAWVGGNDYAWFRFDHVELGKRQTGSTFKPFVYAAAIDNGMTPCTVVPNSPVTFGREDGLLTTWTPSNVDNTTGGSYTLREALRKSVNIVTARITKQLGAAAVAKYAMQIGVQSEVPPLPAVCLGTTEMSVLELTGAYSTFANAGWWNEPSFILEIRDREGVTIYQANPESRMGLPEATAYVMADVLKSVAGNTYNVPGGLKTREGKPVDVGGKTGTTQDHSDGWYMGFTPEVAVGIWVGCAERQLRFRSITYGQGAYMARPLFGSFLQRIYSDTALRYGVQDTFVVPPNFDPKRMCYVKPSEEQKRNAVERLLPDELEGW